MSGEIKLNVNGKIQSVQLKKDMSLDDIRNVKAKRILTIFDNNKDGILQDTELNGAMNFSSGTFSVSNNQQIIDYYETDENKKVNYSASWYNDEDGNLVTSTRDDNGDGFVDRAYVLYDKETNTYADIHFDVGKNEDGKAFINKEGNKVVVMRTKDTGIGRLLDVEEGVKDYITYGIGIGTVSKDEKNL